MRKLKGLDKIKIYSEDKTKCFDHKFSNKVEWEGDSQSDMGASIKLNGIIGKLCRDKEPYSFFPVGKKRYGKFWPHWLVSTMWDLFEDIEQIVEYSGVHARGFPKECNSKS